MALVFSAIAHIGIRSSHQTTWCRGVVLAGAVILSRVGWAPQLRRSASHAAVDLYFNLKSRVPTCSSPRSDGINGALPQFLEVVTRLRKLR